MNAITAHDLSNLPSTASGDRIYAIGDIHGRFDLLTELLDEIAYHSRTLSRSKAVHIILLGDLIDRGPQSREVLEYAYSAQRRRKMMVLLGNHEEIMLRAIDGEPGVMKSWLRFGGKATLRSFGIEPPSSSDDFDPIDLGRALRNALPEKWLEWLRSRPISARSGDYLFCHAGIRPGVAINRQSRKDMLWIRDDFLDSDESHGVVVVHGHSISPDVELRHNRVGLDTGAYRTGVLTAAYLEGRTCGIMSTGELPGVDVDGVDVGRFDWIEGQHDASELAAVATDPADLIIEGDGQ